MKINCAWCDEVVEDGNEDMDQRYPVTHGICKKCKMELLNEGQQGASRYLENYNFPVVIVDKKNRVVAANGKACIVLRKKQSEIVNNLPGDILGCKHANEPEGCGFASHCKECKVRTLIFDTMKSGCSYSCENVYIEQISNGLSLTKTVLISSEKINDVVMLMFDVIS